MRSFAGLLALVWLAGSIAAILYSQQQHIPPAVAVPVALAFLVEISLYLGVSRLSNWPPALLAASALPPYLIYSLGTGAFRWQSLALLALLAAAAAFWLAVVPAKPALDLLLLGLMAAVYLAKTFRGIYLEPVPYLRVDTLGQLMWIRLGIAAFLGHRPDDGIGFGFLPRAREWKIGVRYWLLFLPAGAVLAVLFGFASFRLASGWWWKAPATFAGILWVVALAEEFFFRGLLQQRLSEWFGATPGLLAASVAFGIAHLSFREFPNWQFAILAAVAGLFYGLAFMAAGGIRASMVTHALVVTSWRVMLY